MRFRPSLIFTIGLLAVFLQSPSSRADEPVIAERITEENAQELLSDAPDRSGGMGDWYIANEHIWAIIDDVENENLISPSGGTLIDLGPVEGKRDQFVQMIQLLNMNRDIVIPYEQVQATHGEGWAAITVSTSHGLHPEQSGFGVPDEAAAAKIQVATEYRLNSGERYLRIKTTVTNGGEKTAHIFNVADIIYWGDDTIKPFGGSQARLGSSRGTLRGYHHPEIDVSSFTSLMRGMGRFTYIAGGGVEGLPPLAYGLCSPTEYKKNHFLWGINDRMVTSVGIFTGQLDSTYGFWKLPFFGIKPGREVTYERVLAVGEKDDAAAVTDVMFPLLGIADGAAGVFGKIAPSDAGASIIIRSKRDGAPVTQVRAPREGAEAGSFKAVLPPGEYVAEIRSIERDPVPETPEMEPLTREFKVAESGFSDLGEIRLPPQGFLLLDVLEGNEPTPARVIIRGMHGTPDPDLGDELLDFTVGGKPTPSSYSGNWLLMSGNESGPARIGLRPGRYEALATHGFEYSVDRKEFELKPNDEVRLTLHLEHLIETPGMISGDFHVHSIASMDSAFSQAQRVLSFVAEGVDLMIATDHDMLTDYAPVIASLGLEKRIASIVGVESTSMLMVKPTPFTIGHYNAWPMHYHFLQPRRGMIQDERLRPRGLFSRLQESEPEDLLIQVNHGRGREPDGGVSYFNALGTEFGKPLEYNPAKPMNEYPNSLLLAEDSHGTRDIDFDAMEILNGSAYSEYVLLKNDWFSLLNQGYVKTGTANSDTHVKAQLGGYPRNYVILGDPQAKRADERTITEQIRNQHAFGTTGPIIKFTVDGSARPGDLLTPRHKIVNADIRIYAAPWVPLDEVRIYANGRQVGLYPIEAAADEVLRFNREIPLALHEDTWLLVETSISRKKDYLVPQPPGGLYNIIAPGFVPLAFTNPIFVDIDGNGQFDPTGIQRMPSAPAPAWPIKASIVVGFLAVVLVVGRVRRWRSHSAT